MMAESSVFVSGTEVATKEPLVRGQQLVASASEGVAGKDASLNPFVSLPEFV
jgi:hypothetical protein